MEVLSPFFEYLPEIRKTIYTTTITESELAVPAYHEKQTQLYQRRFSEEDVLHGDPTDYKALTCQISELGHGTSASCSAS